MTARSLASTGMFRGVLLLISIPLALAADEAGYSPVAPPAATVVAFRGQLTVVQNWLDDKDFTSATQAARGLLPLVDILAHHGSDADWQRRCTELRGRSTALLEAVQKKDAGKSADGLKQCAAQLEELGKNAPTGKKVVAGSFKARGGTKDWMLLMEGAYIDAKSAKTPKDLVPLAQAIAEEVHAVAYLRTESPWRKSAQEVRDQALKVAALAHDNKLDEAKKELKIVYQRCEVCHGRYQK